MYMILWYKLLYSHIVEQLTRLAIMQHQGSACCAATEHAEPSNSTASRMAGEMFGWEILYKLVENDISKKEDVLVVLLHWYLIKQGFRCIGVGDSKILTEDETGNETLPNGWNQSDGYSLRYLQDGQLFILKGTKSSDDILFNLLRASDLSVSAVHFKPEEIVQNLKGSIEVLMPTYKDTLEIIKNDLVEPVITGKNKEVTTQTVQPQASRDSTSDDPFRLDEYDDPLRIGQPRRGLGVGLDPGWDREALRDPFSVGRSDLDPLGRGGGGMVFNPFGRGGRPGLDPGLGIPGSLPRGSVPPGARFDPFGPPDLNRPGRGGRGSRGPGAPDPDHLPPPGYDDMFM